MIPGRDLNHSAAVTFPLPGSAVFDGVAVKTVRTWEVKVHRLKSLTFNSSLGAFSLAIYLELNTRFEKPVTSE
jgi:hypothetical protein